MDDFLPAYAKVIDEVCPCAASDFESLFNNAFMRYLPESERVKKTLDNHRTEISGKLFECISFPKMEKYMSLKEHKNFLKIMTNLPF